MPLLEDQTLKPRTPLLGSQRPEDAFGFGSGGWRLLDRLNGGNSGFFGKKPSGPSAMDTALADYRSAAYAGRDEEERRGQAQEDLLKQAADAANKPTITQEEIDRRFGREAAQSGRTMLDSMSALREYMGTSGVYGGGLPAGIAANFELTRLGQLNQARGDLMSFKATADANDRQKQFDREQVVGNAVNRPISMLGIDFENQNVQAQLAKYGIDKRAKAAKKSSDNNLLGGIIGAAGPLLGGIL